MSGRKQRQKAKEEPHHEVPVVEEVADEFDVDHGMEMVQEMEPQGDDVMLEGEIPEHEMDVDTNTDKKKSKKKRKPAYAFFVSVRQSTAFEACKMVWNELSRIPWPNFLFWTHRRNLPPMSLLRP